MTRRTVVGWLFVAAQAALLAVLVVLPSGDDWPTPGWLEVASVAAIGVGLVAVVMASLRLGSALTPTPVPTSTGRLTTGGMYRWVRHPIYSGVLLVVVGIAARSGSLVTAAVAVATVGFFHLKARWEEAQLAHRYPSYVEYAARTPRFVPRLRRSVDG